MYLLPCHDEIKIINIRFVPIFEGVHWREGVKRQWSNRKHECSGGLSTLRLQHVNK